MRADSMDYPSRKDRGMETERDRSFPSSHNPLIGKRGGESSVREDGGRPISRKLSDEKQYDYVVSPF